MKRYSIILGLGMIAFGAYCSGAAKPAMLPIASQLIQPLLANTTPAAASVALTVAPAPIAVVAPERMGSWRVGCKKYGCRAAFAFGIAVAFTALVGALSQANNNFNGI